MLNNPATIVQDPFHRFNCLNYNDPFSLTNFTKLIHLNPSSEISATNSGALLSRYSRSSESMLDLLDNEFKTKERGDDFYKKVLQEYGDDSIAEMSNVQVGIEGVSLLAASKITDRRVGISFIEKSTRYVDYNPDSFYIPAKLYEMGLVDQFKELCGRSYKTFKYIFKETQAILGDNLSISDYHFFDSRQNKEVIFDDLSLEDDVKNAERAYKRSIKDKAFDNAGYAWLAALKTNIGFNGNCRTVDYLLKNLHLSPLGELNDLGYHLYDLLSLSIKPFITFSPVITNNQVITGYKGQVITHLGNNLAKDIYNTSDNSVVSLYKHKITQWIQDVEANNLDDSDSMSKGKTNHNMDIIKNILTEMALKSATTGNKIELKDKTLPRLVINAEKLNPRVEIINFMDENYCIDTLCSSILYENNENLLDYDEQNIHNIDPNMRIKDIDTQKIKSGILYDMLNGNKTVEQLTDPNVAINRTTENTIKFNDISAYWQENMTQNDNAYIDYANTSTTTKSTVNKEQDYLIKKYIGNRQSRRDKLGRAMEMIDYIFEISSSFKAMRDMKRHRIVTAFYPYVITTRNSYDSYIFPDLILRNENLFNEYKNLIDDSYTLYEKIVNKGGDYHTAQYANIMGVRTNYVMKTNLRALDHMLSIRSGPQGLDEYRFISQMIYNVLKIIHPNVANLLHFVDLNQYDLGRLYHEAKKRD